MRFKTISFFLLSLFFIFPLFSDKLVETYLTSSRETEYIEVKTSNIPGAGEGAFAKKKIPKDTLLGYYLNKPISMEEARKLYKEKKHYYFFGTPECANIPETPYLDGDPAHYVSKVNFAPSQINGKETKLINVYFKKFCEIPYIRLFSSREIQKGEELYVSYGDGYEYEFMENEEVQNFFLKITKIPKADKFTFKP
jgi:SET domain-containing protein